MVYFKKRKSKYEKLKWHKWFAWYPVVVEITPDGDKKKIWLEYVLRCYKMYYEHTYSVMIERFKKHYKEIKYETISYY